jgi:hypothetical protein
VIHRGVFVSVPLTKRNPPLMTRLKCFFRGHAWVKSKSHPGYRTCRRCRIREQTAEPWVEENQRTARRRRASAERV